MDNNVLVFCEQRRGELQKITLELLGSATKIAEAIQGKVLAVIVGNQITKHTETLIAYGADIVHVVDNENLEYYQNELYTQALYHVIKANNPAVVLIGATSIGRDIAPRLSARLHTGLTADCTHLAVDETNGNLLMTRPAFGGNLYATIICPDHRPQMSTVRPGVMEMLPEDKTRQGTVVIEDFLLDTTVNKVTILEEVMATEEKEKIEDASVLVSVGRGCCQQLPVFKDFASAIGGMVSCSRAVVDAGVLPTARQVGQTGKTVRPEVYFALGISGAVQHIAGMEGSDYIIAINKDKTAPIFGVANLGIVGDATQIISALMKKLKH